MGRLGTFLKPRWLLLAAVVAVFTYLCFAILAPWQLGKNTATEHRNELISDALDTPTAPLADVLTNGSLPADSEWRSVTLSGTYVAGTDVVVRLRSMAGKPSSEILTVFRTDDGLEVVINRGYVTPADNNTPPPIDPPPTGTVTIQGRVRVAEATSAERPPITDTNPPQVYSVAPDQVADLTGTTPIDAWIALDDAQPGGLGTIPLPQLDSGPYLSYGLQWLAFGIMAPLGLGYVVYSELRERRAARVAAQPHPGAPAGPMPPGEPPADLEPDIRAGAPADESPSTTPTIDLPPDAGSAAPQTPTAGRSHPEEASNRTRDKLDARYGRRR